MKKNVKLAYCILTRLLQGSDTITVADVNVVIATIASGTNIIIDSKTKTEFELLVPPAEEKLLVDDSNILVYINSNSKLTKIIERLAAGGQAIKVELVQEKVVVHYQNDDGDTRVSFNMVGDWKNVGVFGIAHLLEDYGYAVHHQYLQGLFSITAPKTVLHDYDLIASSTCKGGSGSGATADSIFAATRYLYEYYVDEINKKLIDTSSYSYFIFLNRLITGITKANIEVGEDFEIVVDHNNVIKSINYQALFEVLKFLDLRAIVGDKKSPMLKIMDQNSGKLIFQIRTKKEVYKTAPTGYRYKIYLEQGAIMEMILNSTENV